MSNMEKWYSLFRTVLWIIIIGCFNFPIPTDGLTCYQCESDLGLDGYNSILCADPVKNNVTKSVCSASENVCLYRTIELDYRSLGKETNHHVSTFFRKCWVFKNMPSNSTNGTECVPGTGRRDGETFDDSVDTMLSKKMQESSKSINSVVVSCFCNFGDNCNDQIYPHNYTTADPSSTTVPPSFTSIPAPGSASQILPRFLSNVILIPIVPVMLLTRFPLKM